MQGATPLFVLVRWMRRVRPLTGERRGCRTSLLKPDVLNTFPSQVVLWIFNVWLLRPHALTKTVMLGQANAVHLASELPHVEGGNGRILYPSSAKAGSDLEVTLLLFSLPPRFPGSLPDLFTNRALF